MTGKRIVLAAASLLLVGALTAGTGPEFKERPLSITLTEVWPGVYDGLAYIDAVNLTEETTYHVKPEKYGYNGITHICVQSRPSYAVYTFTTDTGQTEQSMSVYAVQNFSDNGYGMLALWEDDGDGVFESDQDTYHDMVWVLTYPLD